MRLQTDPKVLREVLLPREEALHAFLALEPSRQPFYFEPRRGWRSVLGNETSLPGTGIHALAKELCDARAHNHAHLLAAIVDPLASLMTLIWAAHDLTCTEEHLEWYLHRYQTALLPLENKLTLRPGLQLVLSGKDSSQRDADERFQTFQRAFQRTLRRMGEAAVDVHLRWIWRDGRTDGDVVRDALIAHAPTPPWAQAKRRGALPKVGELEDLRVKLESVRTVARSFDEDPDAIWEINDKFTKVLPFPPTPARDDRVETESGDDEPQSPLSLLDLKVQARRFVHHALELPLTSITLLGAENAHGKTTVVEAVSQLFQGRPRLRITMPEGAGIWHDTRKGDSSHPAMLMSSLLRYGAEADASSGMASRATVLPLFADDADLNHGKVGETALLAVWGAHTLEAIGKELVQVLRDFEALERPLREVWTRIRTMPWKEAVSGKMGLPADFAKELRFFIRFLWGESSYPGLHNKLKGQVNNFQDINKAELLDALSEEWGILHYLDQMSGFLTKSGWLELKKIDKGLGKTKVLQHFAANTLEWYLTEIRRYLQRYAEGLESIWIAPSDNADPVRQLEQAFDRYFDTRVEWCDSSTVRPNTAQQVRRGMVVRLARWLSVGGIDLPVLILDEPMLGQEASSAVLAAGRYLRLRQKVEAIRWATWAIMRDERLASAREQLSPMCRIPWLEHKLSSFRVHWQPQGQQKNDLPLEPRESDHSPAGTEAGPLPAQVILVSHHTSVLDAIADAEGVVLDYELQQKLQRLIPCEWRPQVRQSINEALIRYGEAIQRGLMPEGAMPTQALRVYWRMPAGLPSPDGKSRFRENSAKALEELGLSTLASQVREVQQDDAAGRALLLWLLWNDLLPAALIDGDAHFEVSGVSLRELPNAGGRCSERGPMRLKRIGPYQEWLPTPIEGGKAPPDPLTQAAGAERQEQIPPTPSNEVLALSVDSSAPSVWRIPLPDETLEESIRNAGMLPVLSPGSAASESRTRHSAPPRIIRLSDSAGIGRVSEVELEALPDALMRLRLEALEPAHMKESGPLPIAVWTYLKDQIPDEEIVFSFGQVLRLQDPAAHDQAPAAWETRIAQPLQHLRQLLATLPRLQNLRLYPHCPPGVALRTGSIFSHRTGFALEVVQNGIPWDVDEQPHYQAPALRLDPIELEGAREATLTELHLLLSFSQDIREGYRRWVESSVQAGGASQRRYVLHIIPESGVGGNVVPRERVSDWAQFVYQALERAWVQVQEEREKERKGSEDVKLEPLATRIFCAAPVALAVAIGRHLNARGRIVTMDYERNAGTYFESQRFVV